MNQPEAVPPYLDDLDLDAMRDEIYELAGYDPRTAPVDGHKKVVTQLMPETQSDEAVAANL